MRKKFQMFQMFQMFLWGVLCCSTAVLAEESLIQKTLQPFIDSGAMPGVVSIFSDAGKLQIDCVGWADVENKVPISEKNIFWIASMTKGITAAAILTLVDEGKLSLDDPVEKYLPEFQYVRVGVKNDDGTLTLRTPKSKMTLRQTLSHTAGFPFILPQQKQFGIDVFSMRHQASIAASQPLLSDPGTQYQYSNVGINVAAAVMEVVTGKTLSENLQERIFDPLGMTETTFHPTPEQIARLVKCYNIKTGKCILTNVPYLQKPYNSPHRHAEAGGGLFSTPLDVLKFYQMIAAKGVFQGKRILSENAVETLSKKQTPKGIPNAYSLGMEINGDWFGHGGALQTDTRANFKTNQVLLYFVQIEGIWNPPCHAAWILAAQKTVELR
ncbi:MAG: serine hydrolase domain-containing protein [Planctomycetia bacterium]|nr:serine hydrolase domain-containing protein [Planctomycetia bacterium]